MKERIIKRIAKDYPDMMTTKQAAQLLGRSEKTLANMRSLKQGAPFIKSGRRVLYPKEEFLTWYSSIATDGKVSYD